ncbi:MAG TPA: hypothetical protein VJV78_40215, partial [Polyangiales bacterium]|nr:hypothetical protein [Polyangiales bacterium]
QAGRAGGAAAAPAAGSGNAAGGPGFGVSAPAAPPAESSGCQCSAPGGRPFEHGAAGFAALFGLVCALRQGGARARARRRS